MCPKRGEGVGSAAKMARVCPTRWAIIGLAAEDAATQRDQPSLPHAAAMPMRQAGYGAPGGTPWPASFCFSNWFNCCGLALPWQAFMTCPTKKPSSFS